MTNIRRISIVQDTDNYKGNQERACNWRDSRVRDWTDGARSRRLAGCPGITSGGRAGASKRGHATGQTARVHADWPDVDAALQDQAGVTRCEARGEGAATLGGAGAGAPGITSGRCASASECGSDGGDSGGSIASGSETWTALSASAGGRTAALSERRGGGFS
jgi:hypothetical protein